MKNIMNQWLCVLTAAVLLVCALPVPRAAAADGVDRYVQKIVVKRNENPADSEYPGNRKEYEYEILYMAMVTNRTGGNVNIRYHADYVDAGGKAVLSFDATAPSLRRDETGALLGAAYADWDTVTRIAGVGSETMTVLRPGEAGYRGAYFAQYHYPVTAQLSGGQKVSMQIRNDTKNAFSGDGYVFYAVLFDGDGVPLLFRRVDLSSQKSFPLQPGHTAKIDWSFSEEEKVVIGNSGKTPASVRCYVLDSGRDSAGQVPVRNDITCRPGDTIQAEFALAEDGDQPEGVMGRISYNPDLFSVKPSEDLIGLDGIRILNLRPAVIEFRVSQYAPAGEYAIEAKVIDAVDADGTQYNNARIIPVKVRVESTAAPAQSAPETGNGKIAVGDYVTFGRYPQTAAGNDQTPIEWLVLARDGNKALLLSRYGLDEKPYNTKQTDVTWETCTLRAWLNQEFLNKAFNSTEQKAILTTNVDNSSSQGYSEYNTNGGNNTQDKVFLLSYAEAHRYLAVEHFSYYYQDSTGKYNYTNVKSRVSPTAYAVKNGAYINSNYQTAEGESAGWWWLRSPGSNHNQNIAAFVGSDGSLFKNFVDDDRGCVRPALWVNLDAVSRSNTEIVQESENQGTAGTSGNQIKAGDYVTFGCYPQTAAGNDQTPIEWQVLEVQGNKALLLSRYGLDAKQYNEKGIDITWETCTLRSWLNQEFMNKAFNSMEQKAILTTAVENSKNQGCSRWSTIGGNNTQDKIFLLSYGEANKYYGVTWEDSSNMHSRTSPTAYALKAGAWTNDSNKTAEGAVAGRWWLRSPGLMQSRAAYVNTDGSLNHGPVDYNSAIVRPALWVNLVLETVMSAATATPEHTPAPTPTAKPLPLPSAAGTSRKKIKAGDYVTFGRYPQTAAGNDQTPIEWLVLEVQGNKALLLSRYGLDAKPYNTEYTDIKWEKCTLRTWLNGEFLKKAFNSTEQNAILTTNVDNSRSQGYSEWSTSGGNNTEDKIFLLSYGEANKYLGVTWEDSNNMKSRVAPTGYALKQGAYTTSSYKTAEGTAAGWWWLRSPGVIQYFAAYVDPGDSLSHGGVDYGYVVVRPALWVNLESGIF